MAKQNILTVFEEECKHVAIDAKLLKRVHAYKASFANRNEDHVRFFGGNLLGVYPIRFKTSDRIEWIDDVLSINDDVIRDRIIALPTVDESWVRGTDVMNLSCVYLVHAIYTSRLSAKDKDQGMMDVLMVFHYKLLTSLMAHFFKYPADEGVALAVYAALSKKFALKQYGNWQAMLEARCRDIIDSNSIHLRTIQRFDDDAAIQYMITDIQGRLRGIIKKLWIVFDTVRAQDARILSVGGTIELDGKQVVRDMARNYVPYKRYLHEIAGDRTRFIKPELIQVIGNAMHTMPDKLLADTLEYVCANYKSASGKDIETLLDETLLHAFEYLHHDDSSFIRSNDLTTLITKLRAVYMSSRSTDPSLMKMRDLSERIVRKAIKSKNPSTIAAVRTGLMLFITTRTFAMRHYG
jgi:hypothetical protein